MKWRCHCRKLTRSATTNRALTFISVKRYEHNVWWSQNVFGPLRPHPPESGNVVNPVKSPSTCFSTVQNLVPLSHTMWAYVGVLKIWKHWGPAPFDRGCSWPKNTPLSACYHTKFGCPRSNGVGIILPALPIKRCVSHF